MAEHKPRSIRSAPIRYIQTIVALVVTAVITALLGLVLAPLLLPSAISAYRARRRWLKRFRQQGRCIDLRTAEAHAATGGCVLLVEVDFKGGIGDAWYVQTSELASCSICPLPVLKPPFHACLKGLFDSQAPHGWCEQHLRQFANTVRFVEGSRTYWRHYEGQLGNAARAVFFIETKLFHG